MTNKNKNKKGFTLIELLVVVAIIGALAAVGVVAYNGYIGAARVNSTKAIHNNVLKYIANERGKCALDEDATIMGGVATCSSEASDVVTALTASTSPLQDKDPYDGGISVVATLPADAGTPAVSMKRGNAHMTSAGDVITLTTYIDKDDTTMTSTITIE